MWPVWPKLFHVDYDEIMINNVDMDRNEAPNYMLFLVLSETAE